MLVEAILIEQQTSPTRGAGQLEDLKPTMVTLVVVIRKLITILWIEETLHQLIDGLSNDL